MALLKTPQRSMYGRGGLLIGALAATVLAAIAGTAAPLWADEEQPPAEGAAANAVAADPPGLARIEPGAMAWLDPQKKRIVMVGEVCLREGPLEMFACLKGTKEHESIVAIPVSAQAVHQALLLLGAKPDHPVQFVPEYKPASGTEIDIALFWTDAEGKRQRSRAQDWIRNARTRRAMEYPWVFGGSQFWVDEREPNQRIYMAEDGDFICVSNFASAMLDIPVESSQSNEALLFEAYAERIPPLGTKVTVVLTPRLDDKKNPEDTAPSAPDNAAPKAPDAPANSK